MTISNPLSGISQERIELFLAQALSELTGHAAQVQLQSATHSPAYTDAGYSKLQINVTFLPPNPEEAEDLPAH
jgi:hypothetical protein